MQNRYVADIGDFGKYGLLKFISSETEFKLGINWCLTEPAGKEKNRNDGKFIDYLDIENKYSNRLKECDEELYYQLKNIIIKWKNNENTRNVLEIKKQQYVILGDSINFYDKIIIDDNRKNWWNEGFNKLSDSEIVFFDPDNGLIINEENNNTKKSPKYIYCDEIVPYFKRGQSLIIYQHANRKKGGFEQELNCKILELKNALNTNSIITIRYKRGTARAYFIIPLEKHYEKISLALDEFMKTNWGKGKHFVTVE